MFERLFSPIQIRGLELRNRVVMSAMGTLFAAASEDHRSVTEKLINYHVARARGGCGLNTVEVCAVDMASSPKGFLSIADDRYISGLRKLTDAVHEAGGAVAVQLWQGSLAVASDREAEILVPSDRALSENFTLPGITVERIRSVIQAFGDSARRSVEAGFDAVEFHCGHNYLPHSFLSGAFNHRQDEWGGSLENRMRFPLECIRAIRKNLPDSMPLFMRVDCQDDFVENGLTPEEVITFCKEAGKAGVDVLNISRGNTMSAALIYEVPPVDLPNGLNVEAAARIRRETGMLTMPAGRINTPELAEKVLADDQADLVVMARAQLADPEFCNKAREGRLTSIKYCIGCDQGCYDYFYYGLSDPRYEHITCTRNPALGEEQAKALIPSGTPKKVLIAGGGIAGIEAADALHRRGDHPILCEAGDSLGGQFLLAGVAPRKGDFHRAGEMAIRNIQDEGVEIRMNTPVTPALIEAEKPDAVILSIGSAPIVPKIPGADGKNVFESHAALAGADVPGGNVVVIGGGLVGIEVAEYFAQKGAHVAVVEMKDAILTEMGMLRKISTQMSMAREDITVLLNTTCKRIEGSQVVVESEGAEKTLPADAVIMAIGSKPRPTQELEDTCKRLNIPCFVVGDAKAAPRLALDAIREAYDAVLHI